MKAIQNLTVCFLSFFMFIFSGTLKAQAPEGTINMVSTAVPFLRISPDARAGGMGDAGIATLPDANASFWNQAKIPFATSKAGAAVTYSPWLHDIVNDVYLATASGYYQIDEEQAVSASLRYFNLGDIQFTDYNGNLLQTYNPREFSIDFGYSRRISEEFGIGVALRYINSKLADGDVGGNIYKAGNAFAGDISLYHTGLNDEGQGLTWGISLSNLGSKIGYTDNANTKEFLPANFGAGLAYTYVINETNKITFALDGNHLLVPKPPTDSAENAEYHNYGVFESWGQSFDNKAFQFSLGGEYVYNNQLWLRAGYYYETKEAGDRKYFTAGLGLKYETFGFNFSYLASSGNGVNRNPLSNTLRFSILFDLGSQNEE